MSVCVTAATGISRQAVASVRAFVGRLDEEARLLPVGEQVAPRPHSVGTVDLTGARLFLQSSAMQNDLVSIVHQFAPNVEVPWDNRPCIYLSLALQVLLHSLAAIHSVWSTKTWLRDSDVQAYQTQVNRLRTSWCAMGWKPTVWLHWVCAHSVYYVRQCRTIYGYTSIPVERRHQQFKRDIRNTFHGWTYKNPGATARLFGHLVALDALDQGLRMYSEPNKRQRH